MRLGAGLVLVAIFAGGIGLLMAAVGYPPAATALVACFVGYLVARSVWGRLP